MAIGAQPIKGHKLLEILWKIQLTANDGADQSDKKNYWYLLYLKWQIKIANNFAVLLIKPDTLVTLLTHRICDQAAVGQICFYWSYLVVLYNFQR